VADQIISEDRVYSSRKFVMALICIALIALGGLVCVKLVAFGAIYPTYIGGILGIAGLYIAGNVTNDFLNNKVQANVQIEQTKAIGVPIPTPPVTVSTTTATNITNVPELSEADTHQDGE
jgi:hypothetical protein